MTCKDKQNIKEITHELETFLSTRKSNSRVETESKPPMLKSLTCLELKQATFLTYVGQPEVSCFLT